MPSKITLGEYFKRARKEKWAIGQFNFFNSELLKAIIEAAKILKSPVILGTSEGESKFLGFKQAVLLIESYRKETGLPIFLNLDHGKSFGYIKEVIDAGYDSVHFDGSLLPLAENIRETRKIIEYAHKKGVWVEGEVGVIGGELADIKEAQEFACKTEVDSLAINIGTWHGEGEKTGIDFQRLEDISKTVKSVFLVLHGGSGVPGKDIEKAIKLGIVKININTELRATYTGALKEALKTPEIIPYKYMPEVVQAVQKVVESKINLFGSKNKWLK